MFSPHTLIHCDWSISPRKRWLARATRQADGRYRVDASEPVPLAPLQLFFHAPHSTLIGFDLPIGLPLAYARQIGCASFIDFLEWLKRPEWASFFEVAETKEEIGRRRPFYPARPGGTRQHHLLNGLGVAKMNDLRRVCERATADRTAAAPLFWTMGAQQVGKAALSAWGELLLPGRAAAELDVALWPFEGELETLLSTHRLTIAECYPGEVYRHLHLRLRNKRDQGERQGCAAPLLAWAAEQPVVFSPSLIAEIEDGFGNRVDGEDRFDAVVGLLGMLNVILGHRPAGEPANDEICQIEGWILGQSAAAAGSTNQLS